MTNTFILINAAGGSGGTYRLTKDGHLPLRAIRALIDAPWGGWDIVGPAAFAAIDQWRHVSRRAWDAGISPVDIKQ